jgi:hypothetical protein
MRCEGNPNAAAVPATVNGEPFVNLPLGYQAREGVDRR